MKIINICANFGGSKDGIGDYSSKIVNKMLELNKDVKIRTFSSNIEDYSKLKRIFSLKMSFNIKQAYKLLIKEKHDLVNIEYPFTEWNPLILYFYNKLVKVCNKKNVRICISLHEYDRVNILRKLVIKLLIKKADFILVTSNEIKKHTEKYNSNSYIRHIPSNIYKTRDVELGEKVPNTYVFFGLINSSKAFDEMINGWKNNYNKIENGKLIIITSSNIELEENYGIEIRRNLSDSEIENIMQKSTYTILPIKPMINMNNATLKTATLFGNIPIGKFSKSIKDTNKKFYIEMENYEDNEFSKVFEYIRKIEKEKLNELQKNSIDFGNEYKIDNIANTILNIYAKEIKEDRA